MTDEGPTTQPAALGCAPAEATREHLRPMVACYRQYGWHTLVIAPMEKKPPGKWKTLDPAEPDAFAVNVNVGVVLGEKSRGLVDIDLDLPEAARVADHLLNDMPSFGRASNPRSHRLALCVDPATRVAFDLGKSGESLDLERTMVLELRGNGHQTVFPPSMHPSGEVVTWAPGELHLPETDWATLRKRAGLCAFLGVILKFYPRTAGHRDEVCLALAGALVRAGFDDEQTDRYIELVARLAGDAECHKRGDKARPTRAKIDKNEPCWALPELCKQLGIAAVEDRLRDWIGGSADDAIVVIDGKLVEIVDKAEQRLIAAKVPLYQRGQALVRTARLDTNTDDGGVRRANGTTILMETSQHWLTEQFARSALWLAPRKEGELRPIDPPSKYAAHYLARAGSWLVPPLLGIVHTPTLRRDGSILQEPGYDPTSFLIYDPLGVEFPPIPDAPTKADAERALCEVESLFKLFPFVDAAAGSVVSAAVLTALVRRSISTAPLFAIDAPTAGTGKSLIADTIGIIAAGHAPAAMSQGKSVEEDEKRLSTLLMAGDPIILLDNCDLPVEGDFLCSMLTQEMVQARILGRSERMRLPSNALVIATGNNLTLAGDVSRRAVLCRMDAGVERPDSRQFNFNPRDVARDRRTELVVAGLTVLRAYIAAGRPSPLPKIGSFEEWNLIREPLVWLGRADPADTRSQVLANDPRKADLVELLAAWRGCFGDGEQTLAKVRVYCEEDAADAARGLLWNLLVDQTGRGAFSTKSIGRHLKRHVDRVVQGMALRRRDTNVGSLWRVERSGDQRTIDYGRFV